MDEWLPILVTTLLLTGCTGSAPTLYEVSLEVLGTEDTEDGYEVRAKLTNTAEEIWFRPFYSQFSLITEEGGVIGPGIYSDFPNSRLDHGQSATGNLSFTTEKGPPFTLRFAMTSEDGEWEIRATADFTS